MVTLLCSRLRIDAHTIPASRDKTCDRCAQLQQQLDYAISLLQDARLYCDTVSTGEDIDDFITGIALGTWTPPRPMTPHEIDQFIARAVAQCQ